MNAAIANRARIKFDSYEKERDANEKMYYLGGLAMAIYNTANVGDKYLVDDFNKVAAEFAALTS
jgi:hypothetical protein